VCIDYRIVPGSFPNPVVSVGVCYTAVDAAAGGLTTGWWAVVLECFSSNPLVRSAYLCVYIYTEIVVLYIYIYRYISAPFVGDHILERLRNVRLDDNGDTLREQCPSMCVYIDRYGCIGI